nr:molybdopterin synthase catalytic subunit like [Tanacetum cinerariifolium]
MPTKTCFELEEWGPIEWAMMCKHFERQGKSPYAYHAMIQFFHFVVFSVVSERPFFSRKSTSGLKKCLPRLYAWNGKTKEGVSFYGCI